jgi:Ala-tRNA(Pro) deacylase
LNDAEHRVKVRLDEEFRGQLIGVHPNENTATVYLQADDLLKLLRDCGADAEYAALI